MVLSMRLTLVLFSKRLFCPLVVRARRVCLVLASRPMRLQKFVKSRPVARAVDGSCAFQIRDPVNSKSTRIRTGVRARSRALLLAACAFLFFARARQGTLCASLTDPHGALGRMLVVDM
ncbi:hypothetical protein V1511DRAFT_489326 [Dipodascopsis uninucleata]